MAAVQPTREGVLWRTDTYVLDVGIARVEFDDMCSSDTLQRIVRALRAC